MPPKKKKGPSVPARGFATTSIIKPKQDPVEEPKHASDDQPPKSDAAEQTIANAAVGTAAGKDEPDSWETAASGTVEAAAVAQTALEPPSGVSTGMQDQDGGDRSAATAARLSSVAIQKVEAELRAFEAKRNAIEADASAPPLVRLDAALEREVGALCSRAAEWKPAQPTFNLDVLLQRLHIVYVTLERLGFQVEDCETAMKSTGGVSVNDCVDWLCVHIPTERLPQGFTDKVNLDLDDASVSIGATVIRTTKEPSPETGIQEQVPEPPTAKKVSNISKEEKEQEEQGEQIAQDRESPPKKEVDSQMKKWILQRSLEDEDEDLDGLEPLHKPSLPLHVEHAQMLFQADELKQAIMELKGNPEYAKELRSITAQLKKVMGRIKEIETGRGWNAKVKRKAEVEYAKLVRERGPLNPVEAPKRVESKPSSDVQKEEAKEEEEDNDNLGVLSVFDEPAPKEEPKVQQSVNVKLRSFPIPDKWSGYTPKNMLRDHCSKLGKQVKIKYERPKGARVGGGVSVKISGIPNSEERIIGMEDGV
ncbi:hypothetical protein HDU96_005730, partial [Phlyctochytrium bullatum]